jgi:2-keto-4-pentenoate hydratase/2-oxohepta-3-ene-1,7-dioic acid hydratase in catechol pathway
VNSAREGIFMLWCRFQKDKSVSCGIVEGDHVTAIEGDPFGDYRTTTKSYRLADVRLLVPVLPPTFYAIGSNYRNHVEGRAKTKGTAPKFYDSPRVGYRANSALTATNETIVKPKDAGERFEYEGELVAVIGKPVRNATPEEATRAIFGWTIGNDVTERDWQSKDPTNLRAKNADTFKPMGPWIATGIEPAAMTTRVRLNGTPLHTFPTGNMLFSAGEVISAISRTNTLSPGDVVWLGTDEVPQSLHAGDVIEIEISGIGVLRNRVVAED